MCEGKAPTNLLGIHSWVKLSFPGLLANTWNMFSLSVLLFIAGPACPPSGVPKSFRGSGCVVPLDPQSYGHGSEHLRLRPEWSSPGGSSSVTLHAISEQDQHLGLLLQGSACLG